MVIGYDTGCWRLYLEDNYLCFAGMLGNRHETEEQAMELIKRNIDDDLHHGTVEKTLKDGYVLLYFLSKLEKKPDDATTYISMTTYVSSAYGEEVLNQVREYDKKEQMNLKVL